MEIKKMSEKEILSQIGLLRNQGFDQIKLPGGTSKNGEHYCGLVVCFFDKENKTTYFLGLPYNSNFHKTNNENVSSKVLGESPQATARRELMEETGYFVEKDDLVLIDKAKKVLGGKIPGTEHVKYFFLVEEFNGNPFEFKGENPIDGETSAPIWIPANLFSQLLWGGHQYAFREALNLLMSDKNIYESCSNLLVSK